MEHFIVAKKELTQIYSEEVSKIKNIENYDMFTSITKLLDLKISTNNKCQQIIYVAVIFRLLGSILGCRILFPTQKNFSKTKFKNAIKERLQYLYNNENIEYCKIYYKKLFFTTDTTGFKCEKRSTLSKEKKIFNELMKYNCDVGYFHKDSLKA